MRRQRRDVYRPRNGAADDNLVAGAGRRLGVHEDLLTRFMPSCWLPGCRGNRWFPRWAGEERHGLSVSAARNSSSLAADGVTRQCAPSPRNPPQSWAAPVPTAPANVGYRAASINPTSKACWCSSVPWKCRNSTNALRREGVGKAYTARLSPLKSPGTPFKPARCLPCEASPYPPLLVPSKPKQKFQLPFRDIAVDII